MLINAIEPHSEGLLETTMWRAREVGNAVGNSYRGAATSREDSKGGYVCWVGKKTRLDSWLFWSMQEGSLVGDNFIHPSSRIDFFFSRAVRQVADILSGQAAVRRCCRKRLVQNKLKSGAQATVVVAGWKKS